MSEYVDFHYMPLEGKITGKQVLQQTEDAINDLGEHVYELDIDESRIDEAVEKSEQAIETADAALSAVTTDRAVWKNTVAEMKATDIDLGVTAVTRGEMVFNDGNGAFYGVRSEKSGDVDSDDTVFLNNGNVAERIQSMNIIAKGNNIIFVASVAELIDSDALIGNVYGTAGYYSANDGGAGLYSIRTKTQSDVEDGGSIIFLDNGNVAECIDLNIPRTFDTVADLKNASLFVGLKVSTKGYYSVNDGGSALYTIRAKDVADVDDGGSIIFLDNQNVAELITDGTVNVKQFGAKGDGVTDDATAINDAVAYGDTIIFPPGTYRTSTINVTSNKELIGYNAELQKYAVGSGYILGITDSSNVTISGFTLHGRSEELGGEQGPDRHNIRICGSSCIVLENIVSKYAGCDCLLVIDDRDNNIKTHDIVLTNCQFLYGYRQGMSVISCDGLTATNCHFSYTGRSSAGGYNPKAGVDLEANGTYETPQNCTFINCHFENNDGAGIEGKNQAKNLTIIGCYIKGNSGYGVLCCANSVTIIENTVISDNNFWLQDSLDATRGAIEGTTNSNVIISNVRIENTGGEAIELPSGNSSITNVIIKNCGYSGLHLYSNSICKNVEIYDTYKYRDYGPSYSGSVIIHGDNISLENVKIVNDADIQTPIANYGLKIHGSYNNVNLRNINLDGTFDTAMYGQNSVSNAEGIVLNGDVVHIRATRNTGKTILNTCYAISGTSAPVDGTWGKGDKVYNTSPSAGGYVGWICTAAGTPGTWKGFGLIEA